MKKRSLSIVRILGVLAFVLALLSVTADSIDTYNRGVVEEQEEILRDDRNYAAQQRGEISFGIYILVYDDRPHMRLVLLVLTAVGAVLIWRSVSSKLGLILVAVSILIFALWSFRIIHGLSLDWAAYRDLSWLAILSQAGNLFDYLLFLTISILFGMLINNLFSLLRSNSSFSNDLP